MGFLLQQKVWVCDLLILTKDNEEDILYILSVGRDYMNTFLQQALLSWIYILDLHVHHSFSFILLVCHVYISILLFRVYSSLFKLAHWICWYCLLNWSLFVQESSLLNERMALFLPAAVYALCAGCSYTQCYKGLSPTYSFVDDTEAMVDLVKACVDLL